LSYHPRLAGFYANIVAGFAANIDSVEGGDAVFSLLSSEEYSPFWKFMQSDILAGISHLEHLWSTYRR
jgi:hypothetical protein